MQVVGVGVVKYVADQWRADRAAADGLYIDSPKRSMPAVSGPWPYDFAREIGAAVDWWATVLCEGAKRDSGDAKLNSQMRMIESLRPIDPKVDPYKVQSFRDAMTKGLRIQCERHPASLDDPQRGSILRVVACDYQPGGVLFDAANLAGIDQRQFPIKTTMWIDPGAVTVRYGYGAEITTVLVTDEGQRHRYLERASEFKNPQLVRNYQVEATAAEILYPRDRRGKRYVPTSASLFSS